MMVSPLFSTLVKVKNMDHESLFAHYFVAYYELSLYATKFSTLNPVIDPEIVIILIFANVV